MNSQPNIAVFSAAIDSENKIIQILHRNGQKKNWAELSSSGQEPTFKASFITTAKILYNIILICTKYFCNSKIQFNQKCVGTNAVVVKSVHCNSTHSVCFAACGLYTENW